MPPKRKASISSSSDSESGVTKPTSNSPSSHSRLPKRFHPEQGEFLKLLSATTLQRHLPLQKRQCLQIFTGQLPPASRSNDSDTPSLGSECIALDQEWLTLYSMLRATVSSKEANSCLLIGSSSSGKSLVLDSVLRKLQSGQTQSPFYRVSLTASVQTTDRAAMREMAQQLIIQGAFSEQDVIDTILLQDQDDEKEQEELDEIENDQVFGGDTDDSDGFALDEQEQDAMAGAILSSLSNIISHIISLLSTTSSSSRKPLIITLDDFDLFTSRPRQALLYCLLDAVQAGSYGAGLAVVGLTSRVDTTDLLEKRVKSRFSHRIIHIRPPSSYETFEKIAHSALNGGINGPHTDNHDHASKQFAETWVKEVNALMNHSGFKDVLRGIYELSNDTRMLYKIFTTPISALSLNDPTLRPESFIQSASEHMSDGMMHVLRDLTEPELALLIAAKQLRLRDRKVFNFEMCFDELRRFANRENRERQALSSSASLKFYNNTNKNHSASLLSSYADRKVALMSFNTLLSLEIFLADHFVSSLSISNSSTTTTTTRSSSTTSTTVSSTNLIRKEFLKVRCIIDPPLIIRAVKDKNRSEAISSSLVKWATAHG